MMIVKESVGDKQPRREFCKLRPRISELFRELQKWQERISDKLVLHPGSAMASRLDR